MMTLEEYIKDLNAIIKENPDLKTALVVYSKDDEGNFFKPVYYGPQLGYYSEDDNEFYSEDDNEFYSEDDNEFDDNEDTGCIAVCIN